MKTLTNVVLLVLVLSFAVSADAQGTRVDAVQVDAIDTTDAATYIRDTDGRIYHFPATADTAVNAIDANVDTGSVVDPSGCLTTADADGTFVCSVLYGWTDNGWTTVYADYTDHTGTLFQSSGRSVTVPSRGNSPDDYCRQVAMATGAFSNVIYEGCLKLENEAAERLRRRGR